MIMDNQLFISLIQYPLTHSYSFSSLRIPFPSSVTGMNPSYSRARSTPAHVMHYALRELFTYPVFARYAGSILTKKRFCVTFG
jgi:hypothetical protein